jgi:hypothetical protein
MVVHAGHELANGRVGVRFVQGGEDAPRVQVAVLVAQAIGIAAAECSVVAHSENLGPAGDRQRRLRRRDLKCRDRAADVGETIDGGSADNGVGP